LHNVYSEAEDDVVHAVPQTLGKISHESIDKNKFSSRKEDITGLTVYSEELGIIGKIDIYKGSDKALIERKYKLVNIYQGQIYQLWAQYFCMLEMGYSINKLSFYSISTNQTFSIDIPDRKNKSELINFIKKFKSFDPSSVFEINYNKCIHCIYCNLCDKTNTENVYS